MLLNYADDGPGPVVVLIHGFPLDLHIWDAQRTTIGSTYRVIAPDLRGFGKTAAPEGIYAIDDMADDVVELLDALKISEPVVVGGLSMGGYIALSMAVRHAKRLRGLMLMNTRSAADPPEIAEVRDELARAVESSGSVDAVVSTMMPRMMSDATLKRRPELLGLVKQMMEHSTANGVAGALRGMASRPDRTADLPRINIPTLVITSSDDIMIPPEESRKMAEALPSAELVVIPDSGHLPPVEQPAAVNAAILRFLGSLA